MSLIDRSKMEHPYADGATFEEKVNALIIGVEHSINWMRGEGRETDDLEMSVKLVKLIPKLFDVTAHGEEGHREWLKAAIENHFQGLPMPEYKAK